MKPYVARALLLIAATWASGLVQAEVLELENAVRLAVAQDPEVVANRERALSLSEGAAADGELPDPKLKFGVVNLPVDSFSLRQEPVTQIQLGVQQAFPPGETLTYRRQAAHQLAAASEARADNLTLLVAQRVRESWYETYYWSRARAIVMRSEDVFELLVSITRRRYAVGGRNQQDVIRSELELELLRDRISMIRGREMAARGELARFVGPGNSMRALPEQLPHLDPVPELAALLESLGDHPSMTAEGGLLAAARARVELARQAYKPKWLIDVTYGARNGENQDLTPRADFLSAMISVDIPIRPGQRQDRRLRASHHEATAALESRAARLRELEELAREAYADWESLSERLGRYDTTLIQRAAQNVEAALDAYQSDRGDFTQLMRARLTELETQLNAMRLTIDRAKAHARLLYLAGVVI